MDWPRLPVPGAESRATGGGFAEAEDLALPTQPSAGYESDSDVPGDVLGGVHPIGAPAAGRRAAAGPACVHSWQLQTAAQQNGQGFPAVPCRRQEDPVV